MSPIKSTNPSKSTSPSPSTSPSVSMPFVSVILAVRNEARYIAQTLDAVLLQDYPREALEIVVADGESSDGTLEAIRSVSGAERVRVISNPGRIQAAGLNLAIHAARGDVVVRVDGHTIIAPDYVSRCVEALQTTGAAAVGGRMKPIGITPMGQAIALAGTTRFAVPTAFHVSAAPQFTDTVYLGAWPRALLLGLGGFDEGLRTNEDYELNYRIRSAGGRVYLSPVIHSTYVCRQTLRALAAQYLRYGAGKAQMLAQHPTSVRARQLVAPAFVALLVGGLALWPLSLPLAHALFVGVLACYGTLAVGFAALAGVQAGRVAWRLPLVYLTTHLAWGCGFWWGMGCVVGRLVGAWGTRPSRATHATAATAAARHHMTESVAQTPHGKGPRPHPLAAEALGLEDRHGL